MRTLRVAGQHLKTLRIAIMTWLLVFAWLDGLSPNSALCQKLSFERFAATVEVSSEPEFVECRAKASCATFHIMRSLEFGKGTVVSNSIHLWKLAYSHLSTSGFGVLSEGDVIQ